MFCCKEYPKITKLYVGFLAEQIVFKKWKFLIDVI